MTAEPEGVAERPTKKTIRKLGPKLPTKLKKKATGEAPRDTKKDSGHLYPPPLDEPLLEVEDFPETESAAPKKTPSSLKDPPGVSRCGECGLRCRPGQPLKTCSGCAAKFHSACWGPGDACPACGSPAKVQKSTSAVSGLAIASVVVGGSSVFILPIVAAITAVAMRSGSTSFGIAVLCAGILVPAVGLMLGIRAWMAKDERKKTVPIVGVAVSSIVFLISAIGAAIAFRAPAVAPDRGRDSWADRQSPAWDEQRRWEQQNQWAAEERKRLEAAEQAERLRIEQENAKNEALLAGESLDATWREPTAAPSTRVAPTAEAGTPFRTVGEPDAAWKATVASDAIVGGAASTEWKPSGIAMSLSSKRNAVDIYGRLRNVWAADRSRFVILDRDGKTALIHVAGETKALRAQASAPVGAMVLAGNRLICGHPKHPFLSVFDATTGELVKEVSIPEGNAMELVAHPTEPRLVLLFAGTGAHSERGHFVAFDAASLRFGGSVQYQGTNLYREEGARFTTDGRFFYCWRENVGPTGVIVVDAAQEGKEVLYQHESWEPLSVTRDGRWVFTRDGIYRSGLVERVSTEAHAFLGHLPDGNLLVIEHGNKNEASPNYPQNETEPSLAVLDARDLRILSRSPLGLKLQAKPYLRDRLEVYLIPGTNRVFTSQLARNKKGETFRTWSYRDVPLAPAAEASKKLAIESSIPRQAFIGQTWKLPIALVQKDARAVKVEVSGPRGAAWDEATKTVTWTPTLIQRGEQSITIKVSAEGYEELVLEQEVKVDYRTLRLTQLSSFGVLPSERWIWWTQRTNDLVLMDPVSGEQKKIALGGQARDVVEVGGKLYVGLHDRIVEVDPTAAAPTRELDLKPFTLSSLEPHGDGKSLACTATRADRNQYYLTIFVGRIPLDGSKPTMRAIPSKNPQWEGSPFYTTEGERGDEGRGEAVRPRAFWLDSERFVLGGNFRSLTFHAPYPVFRWTEKKIEAVGEIPGDPTAALADGSLIFTKRAVVEPRLLGSRRDLAENEAILPARDGSHCVLVKLESEELAAEVLALPSLEKIEGFTYQLENDHRSGYGFHRAFVVGRTGTILALSQDSDRGTNVYFFPYEAAKK